LNGLFGDLQEVLYFEKVLGLGGEWLPLLNGMV